MRSGSPSSASGSTVPGSIPPLSPSITRTAPSLHSPSALSSAPTGRRDRSMHLGSIPPCRVEADAFDLVVPGDGGVGPGGTVEADPRLRSRPAARTPSRISLPVSRTCEDAFPAVGSQNEGPSFRSPSECPLRASGSSRLCGGTNGRPGARGTRVFPERIDALVPHLLQRSVVPWAVVPAIEMELLVAAAGCSTEEAPPGSRALRSGPPRAVRPGRGAFPASRGAGARAA